MNSSEKHVNVNMNIKNKNTDVNDAVPQPQVQAHEEGDSAQAQAPEGLKLLFAASQIETTFEDKDEDEGKDAEANGAGAEAEAPSNSTAVSNGTVAGAADLNVESGSGRKSPEGEEEAGIAEAPPPDKDSETENLAIAALENQEKSFPQILHEILATTECQFILHWLPDGFSFIIADKQRFSGEILPEYFRGALLNSFIRKLNRWGFRRVKSRSKGEESSFAHKNFVRDKPWLCLKMMCNSKPTYHKLPSAKKPKKKKKAKQKSTATAFNFNSKSSKSLAAPVTASIVAPTKAPYPFAATNGTANRAFVPTLSRMAVSEHGPLPLTNPIGSTALPKPKAPAPAAVAPARFLSTATASKILERQRQGQCQHLVYHQERIFHERQILAAQMRRRYQLQLELQRLSLKEMSSQIGDQFVRSLNVHSAMQAQYARGMLNNRDNQNRGGRTK